MVVNVDLLRNAVEGSEEVDNVIRRTRGRADREGGEGQ